jgi:osmoprotectant transport system ATP-binding protein
MIVFDKVGKDYGTAAVVDNVSLDIADGELFVLVGPSGSGKTTMLKMVNRLVDPSRGDIRIDGRSIRDMDPRMLRLGMGYVLQQIALFPNLSVGQNAMLTGRLKGWDMRRREKRARHLLDEVGLPSTRYFQRMPRELSGGEQQRVGIVRALLTGPDIMLMDEPFSALDPISRRQLQELTLRLHQSLGITIMLVTHDIDEALLMADRIAVLHSGHVEQVGAPKEVTGNPSTAFVREFFGIGTRMRREAERGKAASWEH